MWCRAIGLGSRVRAVRPRSSLKFRVIGGEGVSEVAKNEEALCALADHCSKPVKVSAWMNKATVSEVAFVFFSQTGRKSIGKTGVHRSRTQGTDKYRERRFTGSKTTVG